MISISSSHILIALIIILIILVFRLNSELQHFKDDVSDEITNLVESDVNLFYFQMEVLMVKGIVNIPEAERSRKLHDLVSSYHRFAHMLSHNDSINAEQMAEYWAHKKQELEEELGL